ncbi:MAG: hypothetical protein L0027_15870 [Candidatus Rokubacteria bacterium]|nr:hypothetical protein [Candidatus Rokubacteria bacterium]
MARPRKRQSRPAATGRRHRPEFSLPFEPGGHRRVAVKIVDDRGIESLRIIPVP